METRDEIDEQAPATWLLRTPTRRWEVWAYPLTAALLAVLVVVTGFTIGGPLASTLGVTTAVVVVAAGVAVFVTGWSAYAEQTRAAAWRNHVVRVVAGSTVVAVVSVASLAAAVSVGTIVGAMGGVVQMFVVARSVPRIDRLAVAWAATAVAVAALVFVVLGLFLPGVSGHRTGMWVGPGSLVAVIAVVLAVVQFRAAARAPRH